MYQKRKSTALAYLANNYSGLTHTFIHNEVRELRRLGTAIRTYSIHRPSSKMMCEEYRYGNDDTFYVFPLNIRYLFCSHIHYFFKNPFSFLSLLYSVLVGDHPKVYDRVRTFYHFCEAAYLARKFEEDGISHVHVHFAAGTVTSALIISKLTGITYSFTSHGTALLVERVLLQKKISSAKFIVAVSDYNKKFMLRIDPESEKKIFVVHCGIDPSHFSPTDNKANGPFTILSVGSLVPAKGHSFLIEACNSLRNKGFRFRCIIIGEGPERKKLEKQIDDYGIADRVTLKGAVAHNKVQDFLNSADVFLLASLSEGIPVALMEAMSKRIPVVSTAITGIPELVENNVSGFLIPPKDVEQLSKAISLLIDDETIRKKLGQNGRKKVMKDFNLETNVAKLKSIFDLEV